MGTPKTEESVYNALVTELLFRCFTIPAQFRKTDKLGNYELQRRESSMYTRGERTQHGKPDSVVGRGDQLEAGDGQRGRDGVAERLVLLRKPGNAGGGKGP